MSFLSFRPISFRPRTIFLRLPGLRAYHFSVRLFYISFTVFNVSRVNGRLWRQKARGWKFCRKGSIRWMKINERKIRAFKKKKKKKFQANLIELKYIASATGKRFSEILLFYRQKRINLFLHYPSIFSIRIQDMMSSEQRKGVKGELSTNSQQSSN